MFIAISTVVSTFLAVTQGLLVEPLSPCADLCGNTLASTSGSEITCTDGAYGSSTYGAAFEQCINCELSSQYVNPATQITDLHWAIYNLRFAISWCLFGWDNNTQPIDSPCLTKFSCGPLRDAFEYGSLNQNTTSYSFCPLMISISIPKCSQCLSEMGSEDYLSNFVTVLDAACIQQPVPGATLSLQGSVFSSTVVNITTPTPTSGSIYTASKNGLTLGAKAGIAVAGLVLVLVVIGFCIVWRGKRRRRKILAAKARASGYEWQAAHGAIGKSPQEQQQQQPGPFFDSPQSQRPFAHAWGEHESPVSPHVEKAYFSPYSSQYTSPVSANDRIYNPQEWPRDHKTAISPDGPSHAPAPASDWPMDSKTGFSHLGIHEEEGERIEMQGINPPVEASRWQDNVAPVLSHPGLGRGSPDGGGDGS